MSIKVHFEVGELRTIECDTKEELDAILNYERLESVLKVGGGSGTAVMASTQTRSTQPKAVVKQESNSADEDIVGDV